MRKRKKANKDVAPEDGPRLASSAPTGLPPVIVLVVILLGYVVFIALP